MKKELNKWQFDMGIGKDWARFDAPGWFVFHLYLLKLRSFPPEGAMLHEINYRGFMWKFKFWVPFDRA